MDKRLLLIYKLLFDRYSNRGWWPVTPDDHGKSLMPVYGIKNKTDNQRFEIIIGAILTQNTSWKNVEKALVNLNKHDLVYPEKILKMDLQELTRLIRPAGYYNQKADRLKIIANFILQNPIQELRLVDIQPLRKMLLSIKGVGPETADSIILYAIEKPIFVIDAYTVRTFSRIGYKKKSYDDWQSLFMENLSCETSLFNEYHALIVELGKEFCRKKPLCGECILFKSCKKDLNNLAYNR